MLQGIELRLFWFTQLPNPPTSLHKLCAAYEWLMSRCEFCSWAPAHLLRCKCKQSSLFCASSCTTAKPDVDDWDAKDGEFDMQHGTAPARGVALVWLGTESECCLKSCILFANICWHIYFTYIKKKTPAEPSSACNSSSGSRLSPFKRNPSILQSHLCSLSSV